MEFNFSSDLFLDVHELTEFKNSLDSNGWRYEFLKNLRSTGLFKNKTNDPQFLNGRCTQGTDYTKLIISKTEGVDSTGNFFILPQTTIPTIEGGTWFWIKVKRVVSLKEPGFVSISSNGLLQGDSDCKFLSKLRGQPNFPTRISFSNSQNTGQYDILEVLSDTQATITHPSLSVAGSGLFYAEQNLKYSRVGTFAESSNTPQTSQYPFKYDSAVVSIIPEITFNTAPSKTDGLEFYLARVRVVNSHLVIQDKRQDFFSRTSKPLPSFSSVVGVESVRWESVAGGTSDENILRVGYGIRSLNFSIDTSQQLLTILGGSGGGIIKDTTDFIDGQLDGYIVYTKDGGSSRVLSSVKQGQSINLFLDSLIIDSYSSDGGVTFIDQALSIVPPFDTFHVKFEGLTFEGGTHYRDCDIKVSELIKEGYIDLKLPVYADPCYYRFFYYFSKGDTYTPETLPISSSYLTELSFDISGRILTTQDRVNYAYTVQPTNGGGYIRLNRSSNSLQIFKTKVDKGDLIGVDLFTDLNLPTYKFTVGVQKKYQYFTGSISLSSNVFLQLQKTGAVEGNQFTFHFQCTDISFGANTLILVQESFGGNYDVLRVLGESDIAEMKNKEGGISFIFTYVLGQWINYQNFQKNIKGEVIQVDGDIYSLFSTSGKGQVRGLYGFALCDGRNGTPDLSSRFLRAVGGSLSVGDSGGAVSGDVTLVQNNLPAHTHDSGSLSNSVNAHTHNIFLRDDGTSVGPYRDANWGRGGDRRIGAPLDGNGNTDEYSHTHTISGKTASIGVSTPFSILPGYYCLIFAKKIV